MLAMSSKTVPTVRPFVERLETRETPASLSFEPASGLGGILGTQANHAAPIVVLVHGSHHSPERLQRKGRLRKLRPQDLSAMAQLVVDLSNFNRLENGIPQLQVNPLLQQAAQAEAELIAQVRTIDHVVNGLGPEDRAHAVGYTATYIGENVAVIWGYPDPPTTFVNNFMNSGPHRANILAAGYREIGVGIAMNAQGEWYAVQMFGS
jgi:uncharacterized protein YkwD